MAKHEINIWHSSDEHFQEIIQKKLENFCLEDFKPTNEEKIIYEQDICGTDSILSRSVNSCISRNFLPNLKQLIKIINKDGSIRKSFKHREWISYRSNFHSHIVDIEAIQSDSGKNTILRVTITDDETRLFEKNTLMNNRYYKLIFDYHTDSGLVENIRGTRYLIYDAQIVKILIEHIADGFRQKNHYYSELKKYRQILRILRVNSAKRRVDPTLHISTS
jgi:hypothetical protein